MPSSFSTNLRLELQAAGENADTWGTKANNVFSMIEAAVSGTASVAMPNANYTLTTVNGTADQARNMMITFTGAVTAVRTVTIPAVSKLYLMRNATTGGFALTISNGTNSVSLANGTSALIWTDGTTILSSGRLNEAYMLDRANHTGSQAISTVTGLQTALDGKVASNGSTWTPHPNDVRTATYWQRFFNATDWYQVQLATSLVSFYTNKFGFYYGNPVYVAGDIYAGATADKVVLHEGNAAIAKVIGLQAALDAKASLTGTEDLTNKTLVNPSIKGTVNDIISVTAYNADGNGPTLWVSTARGPETAPLPPVNGNMLFSIRASGYQPTGGFVHSSRVRLAFVATETWTDTAAGTRIDFATTSNGTLTSATRMTINDGVYLQGATGADKGAGTLNATGLYVNGTSVATATDLTDKLSKSGDTIAGGYTTTGLNGGTVSSGTYAPSPTDRNMHTVTNGGAFTLSASGIATDTTMIVLITNSATAGAVTLSGFTKVTGDSITTTNAQRFFLFITRLGGRIHCHVQALQ